ncbi:hypothetical protein GWI33_018457 [Rhynchophorus ferrugineus]|uniref:Uncharacterized protein n=1 Tax=Rhynchophorus ferrugineus TaxID=354439 RepID=A0A834HX16_RHYFE|nr:hypothetical protein GWI33_018457 [Rhynchophorus ferrugineus]
MSEVIESEMELKEPGFSRYRSYASAPTVPSPLQVPQDRTALSVTMLLPVSAFGPFLLKSISWETIKIQPPKLVFWLNPGPGHLSALGRPSDAATVSPETSQFGHLHIFGQMKSPLIYISPHVLTVKYYTGRC